MKKLLSLFAIIFALLAVACGGDDVDKPTPKPDADAPFVVTITETTRGSVTFDVTPQNYKGSYLCLVYEKEVVEEFTKDEFLVQTFFTKLASVAESKGMTLVEYIPEIADRGVVEAGKFTGLQMNSDYYLVVFGVKYEAENDAYVCSTEIVKTPFKTLDVAMSDCTFTVTPSVFYNTVTLTVRPSDKDVLWYLCTMPKSYYDSYVGEGKMSQGSFYRKYFQDEIATYQMAGLSPADLIHVGSLEIGGKNLVENSEYCYMIAALTADTDGIVIVSDITYGTYTTGGAMPSGLEFNIEVVDIQQMSVAFRITPTNDNPYCLLVRPWDGVSTKEQIVQQMVDQWGPGGWLQETMTQTGVWDRRNDPLKLPAAGMAYYIIAFGYNNGVTSEPAFYTFNTPEGGSIDDLQISVTGSSVNAYGFTLNVTSSDPTIYYMVGACKMGEYDEEANIAAENEGFDYYLTETQKLIPYTTVVEILDQYYYNGSQPFQLSGLTPNTEYMAYVNILDIETGHVVKTLTFDSVAHTGTTGTVNPTIELVGYFSGDEEAGTIFGDAELSAGRAITVVKYGNLEGATKLYTTMLTNEGIDYSNVTAYSEAELWQLTSNLWTECKIAEPYTFYLSDWKVARTALAYAKDADGKEGTIARLYTEPTADNKSDIEVLRTLYDSLQPDKSSTRAELPLSLVVPAEI